MHRFVPHTPLPSRSRSTVARGAARPAGAPRQRRTTPERARASVPEDELNVEIRRTGDRPLVIVSGELDAVGEPLLAAVLDYVRSTEGGPVSVDLRAVPFADTHGLRPVLCGGAVVVAASPAVRRLLASLGAATPRGLPPAPGRRARRPGRAA